MEVIPKTTLKVDPKKPAFEAGKVCDVKKDIAENLLKRGLATLPVVEDESDPASTDSDEASGD